jgi:hypothetical protein
LEKITKERRKGKDKEKKKRSLTGAEDREARNDEGKEEEEEGMFVNGGRGARGNAIHP